MIEVDRLTVKYGAFTAIRDLSFVVARGSILGLLGPNGAGKTTTIRALTGYLPPFSGSVKVAGMDMSRGAARSLIGYLPETTPLYPELTAREFLSLAASVKGIAASERAAQIDRAMDMTKISNRAGSLIKNLSKGYKQRLGFAQAALGAPKVLALDEPTIGLDPEQILEARALTLRLMDSGVEATLLSTHILSDVAAICSDIVIINHGQVVASDSTDRLKARFKGVAPLTITIANAPRDCVLKIEALDETRSARLQSESADSARVEISPADGVNERALRRALVRLIHENDWDLIELRDAPKSLEEIYISIVGDGRGGSMEGRS